MDRKERGFSLLEILVALVILSLSLGLIMRLFSGALNNIGRAERHVHAVALAESALARLGVESPLSEGELAGDDGAGFRWRARIVPYVAPEAVPDALESPVMLYRIALDVHWGDPGAEPAAVRLTTLRVAPRP